ITRSISDAGFTVDLRNAGGATGNYELLGEELLGGGCGVMILADFDGAAVSVASKAREQGVPVIAYDRPISDYLVAFDLDNIGRLEAESVVDGLRSAGKDPATSTVYFVGGDPSDTSSASVRASAAAVLIAAGVETSSSFDGSGDPQDTAHRFAQQLDAKGGRIDAAWVMNDTDAQGVVQVLDARGITVPVSGQGATAESLRNVLRGTQTTTIAKDYRAEARAAAVIAIGLLFGNDLDPETDGFTLDGVPYTKVPVERIGQGQLRQAVLDGLVRADVLCAGAESACASLGIG
ncbi:substrate-binding domain-containing protein, partial [Schumannella luteola]